jgi:uncharacterized repeat protein (TIGR01451 family)
MLEKLLGVLPYNPSLIHQMAFYADRMRDESNIRRTGTIFIVLTFLVQFFAVIVPPQPTVASPDNDLINGGFTTPAEAAKYCEKDVQHYQTILANYGIKCTDLASASTVTLKSTDKTSTGDCIYSMGRVPQGPVNKKTGKKTHETSATIGGTKYFLRCLDSFDTGPYSSYKALKFKSSGTGQVLYILYDCGNLASFGLPKTPITPPPAAPTGTLACVVSTNNSVTLKIGWYNASGKTIDLYRKGAPAALAPYGAGSNFNKSGVANGSATYTDTGLHPDSKYEYHLYVGGMSAGKELTSGPVYCATTKVVVSTPTGVLSCSSSTTDSITLSISWNNASGKTVDLYRKGVTAALGGNFNAGNDASGNSQYTDSGLTQGTTYTYTLYAGGQASGIKLSTADCTTDKPGTPPPPPPTEPCPYNPNITLPDAACKPCDSSINSSDKIACLNLSKTVRNDTTGLADANGTTAQAGNVLTYTLFVQNTGKGDVKDYTFIDVMSDTLDYATISDLHGGTMDDTHTVTWPAETIPAGKTVSHQITFQVKSPIPETPTGVSDGAHFDLVMSNTFGNTVNVSVPGGVVKVVEGQATKLVNTGPGTSLAIAAAVMVLAGFFFSRSRLLSVEADLSVKHNTVSGGM